MDVAGPSRVTTHNRYISRPEHLAFESQENDLKDDEHPSKNIGETNSVRKTPKRGAFPTPRSEIESATPYVPESDQVGDQPDEQTTSPTSTDQEDK
jgi:hypothetical protein